MGRRSRGGSGRTVALVLLVLGVVGASLVAPTASYTVGSADRPVTVEVVPDEEGILKLVYPSAVQTGETNDLVQVTDYTTRPVNVTVALQNGSGDFATLVHGGSTVGDTLTVSLDENETIDVNVDVSCGSSLHDERVYFAINATADGFLGRAVRSVAVNEGECGVPAVFATDGSRYLRAVYSGGDIVKYGDSGVDVVGPSQGNFDGDAPSEVPYITSSDGTIHLVDANGESTVLLTSGARASKARLAVGRWSGSELSVFYAGDAGGIYRITPEGTPVTITTSTETKAKAIAGPADVDDDAAKELVFVGSSKYVKYVDDDGTIVDTNQAVGSNKGVGIGEPADFDGDGVARVPFVTGSNNLALLNTTAGEVTKLGGNVEKTSLATADFDGDGVPEIVYMNKADHDLYYMDAVASGGTTEAVSGDHLAHPEPGVA